MDARSRLLRGAIALALGISAAGCSDNRQAGGFDAPSPVADSSSERDGSPPDAVARPDVLTDLSASAGDGSAPVAKPLIEPYFSIPKKKALLPVLDGSLDAKISELLSLAVSGSTVRATLYKFSTLSMTTPFVQAHARGVDVKLVFDNIANESSYKAVTQELQKELGAQNVHVCSQGACIGDNNNHNKFYLFSKIADPSNPQKTLEHVVVQTSANLNLGHHLNFNDMLVIAGDTKLYDAYMQYWTDLDSENRDTDYIAGATGTVDASAGLRVYFFPSKGTDPVLEHLKDASCPAGGTIRVAQSDFKNKRTGLLLEELIALKSKRGCDVGLVLRDDADNHYISELKASGLSVFVFNQILDLGISVHSKYLLIDAELTVGGSRKRQQVVLTGSSNFSRSGLDNDETILRLENAAIHAIYSANWNKIASTAHPL